MVEPFNPLLLLVIIGFFFLITVLILLAVWVKSEANDKKKLAEKRAAEQQRLALERLAREKAYADRIKSYEASYGELTIEIPLFGAVKEWDNPSFRIYVFEKSQVVLIEEDAISFNKILAYTLSDNSTMVSTTIGTTDTTTSTGSMAGRAIVGDILFGKAGAVVGAMTADTVSETRTKTSHAVTHNYLLYLNIDDLSNPQRILAFGKNEEMANKAASIFNIIIKRNGVQN